MVGTLGIGLVGLGWMGRLHSEAFARLGHHFPDAPRPRFVIAADPDPERRRAATGFEHTTSDWRHVVEHPGVDVVSITAPNDLHRDVARRAAASGKHVWAEKPVGRSAAETSEIAAAIAEAGVLSIVGLDLRFAPVLAHARSILAAGRVGNLTGVRGAFLTDFACDPAAPRTWRYTRERAGYGVLGDLMMHVVDLLTFVVGPVRAVCSTAATVVPTRPDPEPPGHPAPVENEDRVVSLLRFDGDVHGVAEVSRVAAGHHSDVTIEVEGVRGAVSWRLARMNELRVYPAELAGGERAVATVIAAPDHGAYRAFQPGPGLPMGYDDLKVIEAHALCSAIATGGACTPSVADALETARVLEAMERSWRTRGWESVGESRSGARVSPLPGGFKTH